MIKKPEILSDEKIKTFIFEASKKLKETYPGAYNAQEFVTFSKSILNSLLQAQRDKDSEYYEGIIKELKKTLHKPSSMV